MKNLREFILSLMLIVISGYSNAQVGINTTSPQSTLDVTGIPADTSVPDGILIPRITGDELAAKTVYTVAQTGALVYVTTAVTTPNAQTVNVGAAGFYFFDGAVWQTVGGAAADGDAWAVIGEDVSSDVTRNGNIEISDNRGDFRTEIINDQLIGTENGTNRYLTLESERTGNTNPIAGFRWLNTDDSQYTAANIAAVNSNENNGNGGDDGKLLFQTADAGTLTTKMVIENQGNVGVGTQNPDARLQIAPSVTFGAGVTPPETLFRLQSPVIPGVKFATTADIRLGDLNPAGTQTRAQMDFVLSNGSTNAANNEVMTLLGNNRVGIANVAPEATLDVNGTARIRTLNAGVAGDNVITTDTNGNLRQRTAADIVQEGGGLDADGDAWGVTGEDVASNVSRTGNVTIANTNKQALTLQTTDNTLSNGIAFQNSGAAYTWNIFREDAGSNNADLVFSGGGVENDPNNLTERMRIEQNGNVGIGTATPRGGLEISKSPVVGQNVPALSQAVNVANSEDYSLVLSNSDNATIGMVSGFSNANGSFDTYLQSRVFAANGAAQNLLLNPLGGNVGIGNPTPVSPLTVGNTSNGSRFPGDARVGNANGDTRAELVVGEDAANNGFIVMNSSNSPISGQEIQMISGADDANSDFMRIRSTSLEVSIQGALRSGNEAEFNLEARNNRVTLSGDTNSGGSEINFIGDDIGIDNTNPTASVDINGDVRIRDIANGDSTDFVLTSDNDGNVRRRTMQQVVDDGTSAVQQTLATAIVTNNLAIPLTTTLGNPGSTPGETVNQATNINFNVESVDPGNNFDLGTDTYTAPETGSYLVTLTASPNNSPGRNILGFYYATNLQVFNTTTSAILADNRSIRYATPGTPELGSANSLQAIVNLTAGDQVTARVAVVQVNNAAVTASEGISLPNQITFAPQTQNRVIFSIVKL